MKKILVVFLIIIVLGIGAFFAFSSYQKDSGPQGILRLKAYPPEAVLKINNTNYQDEQGFFNLSLNPGKYNMLLSLSDYSFIEKEIDIEPGKITSLGDLFLFPNNWEKESVVLDEDINRFYLTPDSNRIVYISKSSNFDWHLFNRRTQEKELFWETSSLPLDINFSSKKLIANLGNNNWQIAFLPKSLIQNSVSLTDTFKKALTEAELKQGTTSLKIIQANFYSQEDSNLIIRTEDAFYFINFLTGVIERIYEGESSPFLLDENYIYFIKGNGVFSKISFETKKESQVSLYSFSIEDLENTKIRKKDNDNEFLIIEGTQKACYLESPQSLPSIIGENVLDGNFSLNGQEILLNSGNKIEIYNLEKEIKSSKILYIDIPAIWFLYNDYLLFLKDNALNIFLIKENKIWPVASDVKNNNFLYDPSINYIFYLSKKGVLKVGI
jgi:hypothetical protein